MLAVFLEVYPVVQLRFPRWCEHRSKERQALKEPTHASDLQVFEDRRLSIHRHQNLEFGFTPGYLF
jgi:hypothetical protein